MAQTASTNRRDNSRCYAVPNPGARPQNAASPLLTSSRISCGERRKAVGYQFHGGVFVSPVFVSPVFVSPVFVSPVFVSPVFVSPVFVSPVFVSPVFVSPVFVSPVFVSPVFVSPVFVSPVFVSPVFVSPVFVSPVFVSPVFVSSLNLCRSARESPLPGKQNPRERPGGGEGKRGTTASRGLALPGHGRLYLGR